MSEAPDNHELARHLAILEERMNTRQAEYEGALDRLRADMARRDLWFYGIMISMLIGVVLLLARSYLPALLPG